MKMGASLPNGLTISFNPEKGNTEVTQAIIAADQTASAGQYSIIINSTINYKTKGAILKVVIE